jgi:hypothetical protein
LALHDLELEGQSSFAGHSLLARQELLEVALALNQFFDNALQFQEASLLIVAIADHRGQAFNDWSWHVHWRNLGQEPGSGDHARRIPWLCDWNIYD